MNQNTLTTHDVKLGGAAIALVRSRHMTAYLLDVERGIKSGDLLIFYQWDFATRHTVGGLCCAVVRHVTLPGDPAGQSLDKTVCLVHFEIESFPVVLFP